jgi:hypothetical protein
MCSFAQEIIAVDFLGAAFASAATQGQEAYYQIDIAAIFLQGLR